jgi:aarF domain-containing kinase
MVYGKSGVFDADRLIDLLDAFESFTEASRSARGDLDLPLDVVPAPPAAANPWATQLGQLLPFPGSAAAGGGFPALPTPLAAGVGLMTAPLLALSTIGAGPALVDDDDARTREALKFIFSPEGAFFREFLLDEAVKSIDALSRDQFGQLVALLGLQNAMLPVLLPGAARRLIPLAPAVSEEDRMVVANVAKVVNFLSGGGAARALSAPLNPATARELLPFLPGVATEILPELTRKLFSRLAARTVRELFV